MQPLKQEALRPYDHGAPLKKTVSRSRKKEADQLEAIHKIHIPKRGKKFKVNIGSTYYLERFNQAKHNNFHQ